MPVSTRSQTKNNEESFHPKVSKVSKVKKEVAGNILRYPDSCVEDCAILLDTLFKEHQVDSSHGIEHASVVLNHVDMALNSNDYYGALKISSSRRQAMRLAALLHDADDKKYFGTDESLSNAEEIMIEAGVNPFVISDALTMIRLVSCSNNGNWYPERAIKEPEILWPRWADRLEAVGEVGIARCYYYSKKKNEKMFTKETPQCINKDQVLEAIPKERIEEYMRTGGKSKSMFDHYFDKLLHIATPEPQIVRNYYFQDNLFERAQPLINVCIDYGKMCSYKGENYTKAHRMLFNYLERITKKYNFC